MIQETFDHEMFQEKIIEVNRGLKEFLSNRKSWLHAKAYDELHMQRWLLAILEDDFLPKGRRLLDIGAGYGGFAVEASLYGFQVTALELNPKLAEITALRAQKLRQSIDVCVGSVEDYSSDTKYDVITMWNVLEHVNQPAESLRQLIPMLASGGAIYLNVMNRFSLVDPHFHLPGINFLPDPLRIWVCQALRPSSAIEAYKMTFSDLHYFTPRRFELLASSVGLSGCRLDSGSGLRKNLKPSFLYRLTQAAARHP